MSFSLPIDSSNGTLSTCVNPVADETTTGASWTVQGYVTGFTVSKKKNKRAVYEHLVKTCTKPGKKEYSGKVDQMYTKYSEGFAKICDDDNPVAMKFEIDSDGNGTVNETYYFSNVDFDNLSYNYGNQSDGGDVSISCDFTYSDDHCVVSA